MQAYFARGRLAGLIALVAMLLVPVLTPSAAYATTTTGTAVYLRSTVGRPWGSTSNETAMDRVFGVGQWRDLRYETVAPATVFAATTGVVFLEGSDTNANELETFLQTNRSLVERWVATGGSLLLNAAPNEGDGMDFGFGGVTLQYDGIYGISSVTAALPQHPIFQGPFLPVATAYPYSPGSFALAGVEGGDTIPILRGDGDDDWVVLAELSYGGGRVLFGGMTTSNFHSPQPQADNLRANLLAYLVHTRQPAILAGDAFARTVPTGWGRAARGGGYAVSGAPSVYAVNGRAGTMTLANGTGGAAFLPNTRAQNTDVRVRFATNKLAAGSGQFAYIAVRNIGTNTEYRAQLRISPNRTVQARLARSINNAETTLGTIATVPGATHTANSFVWLRVQAVGTNPTTLRIKAWADGQLEPAAWLVTTTDTTPALQGSGTVGLRAFVPSATTNGPVRFSFDDLQVRSAQP